jgi:ankyrin repeat protein
MNIFESRLENNKGILSLKGGAVVYPLTPFPLRSGHQELNPLFEAIRMYNSELVRELIKDPELNINLTSSINNNSMTPLMFACYINSDDIFTILLKDPRINVNLIIYNKTALTFACIYCGVELCRELIIKGADPNIEGIDPILSYACVAKRDPIEKINLLNEYHVDLNARDGFNNTPLIKSMNNFEIDWNYESHDSNDGQDQNNRIVQLLIKLGVNVNLQNKLGHTALGNILNEVKLDPEIYIRFQGRIDFLIRQLIDAGTDVNLQDISGSTALLHAIEINNVNIVHELILHGADINIQDNSGKTALIYAVVGSDIPKINKLIFFGADVTIHDNEGRTALDYARNRANQIIINTIERELRDAVIKVYGDKTSIGGSSTQILLEYIGIPEPANIHIGGYYNKLQKYLNKR